MKKEISNNYIEIKGYNVMCRVLISELDNEDRRYTGYNQRHYSEIIYILQNCIDEYMDGEMAITLPEDFFKKYGIDIPEDKNYPHAIQIMFERMEQEMHIDYSAFLKKVLERSIIEQKKLDEKDAKEKYLCELTGTIMNHKRMPTDIPNRVEYLTTMVALKITNQQYSMEQDYLRKEIIVAELWCSILIHGLTSKFLKYSDMKSLVEQEILDEYDISGLLARLGDKRDYEWYEEDYMGNQLMDDTSIPNYMLLDILEPEFQRILHLEKDEIAK